MWEQRWSGGGLSPLSKYQTDVILILATLAQHFINSGRTDISVLA